MMQTVHWTNKNSKQIERSSFECEKVIGFASDQLRHTIGLKNALHFSIQSKVNLKPSVTLGLFPALCVSYMYLLRVLIGSQKCPWLAKVITLVFVFFDIQLKTALHVAEAKRVCEWVAISGFFSIFDWMIEWREFLSGLLCDWAECFLEGPGCWPLEGISVRALSDLGGGDFLARKIYAIPACVIVEIGIKTHSNCTKIKLVHKLPCGGKFFVGV